MDFEIWPRIWPWSPLFVELLFHTRLWHVWCQVNFVGQWQNLGWETSLNFSENITVVDFPRWIDCRGNEAASTQYLDLDQRNYNICFAPDCHSLVPETSSPSDSMKVSVRLNREIVIKYDIHAFNVQPASSQISSYQNTRLELLELVVSANPKQNIHIM